MKVDVIMPQMGESIAEGTIVNWRKKVGDHIDKEEILLEISTDKVDSEIPSPVAGVLAEILVEEGQTVPVGSVIARIETNEKAVAEKPQQAPAEPEKQELEKEEPVASTELYEKPARQGRPKKFLSPLVKKIAREYGLSHEEVESIQGTGANGRVTKNDILKYLQEKSAAPAAPPPAKTPATAPPPPPSPAAAKHISSSDLVEIIPMDHIRKKIAEHMVFSKNTAPHVTSVAEVDLTRIVNYREKHKKSFEEREGVKLTYTAFFVEVAAKALKEYPLINSSVDGDNIIQKKYINIGIAVGMEKGLIVPVIKNADQMNLVGIARAITDLATRARTKQLKPDDVQDGTFSITNIGTFGNLFGTPVINQPQVAILGTGAIKKRPVVVGDDAIAIRSMAYISLTYDHRIIDGLYGGSFLQRIVQLLENYQFNE